MATFHIKSLRKYLTAGKVRKALKVLPKDVPGIYDEAMHRIESNSDHSGDALCVLSFLVHAYTPLTVVELQHFVAVTSGDIDIDDAEIMDKDILLSICAGLVVVDNKTGIVRLVHFTAQEYFNKIGASKFLLGDQGMGYTCLTYLSFNVFKDKANFSESFSFSRSQYPYFASFRRTPCAESSFSRYALLDYIIHYWCLHVSNHQVALKTPLSIFFKDQALLRTYVRFMEIYRPSYFSYYIREVPLANHGHTGLHAAAAAGLMLVAKWMIEDTSDVNLQDFTGKAALMYACQGGDVEMASLLILNEADVNLGGKYGTPLLAASKGGHEVIGKLLLEHGANINAQGEHLDTALVAASRGGHKTLVKLLFDNGADINAQGRESHTPLLAASIGGHEAVVKLLIENGAEGEYPDTALVVASAWGHEAVVELLIENGAEINAQEGDHSPLLVASIGGHEAAVKLLLKHGANVNPQGGKLTPLTAASRGGHKAVVKLLIENGAKC